MFSFNSDRARPVSAGGLVQGLKTAPEPNRVSYLLMLTSSCSISSDVVITLEFA